MQNSQGSHRQLLSGQKQILQPQQTAMQQGQLPAGQIPGMMQQGMMQPQMGYLSHAINNSRMRSQNQQQGGVGVRGFSYESNGMNLGGSMNELRSELETEAMMKLQCIQAAMGRVGLIYQAINSRSKTGGFFQSFLGGLGVITQTGNEFNKIDPVGEMVYNEIMGNSTIYMQVLGNVGVQMTGELTRMYLRGAEQANSEEFLRGLVSECAGSCALFTVLDFLENHPNRSTLCSSVGQRLRSLLLAAEDNYLFYKGRYEQIPEAQMPWPTGRAKTLFQGNQVHNSLYDLNMYNAMQIQNHEAYNVVSDVHQNTMFNYDMQHRAQTAGSVMPAKEATDQGALAQWMRDLSNQVQGKQVEQAHKAHEANLDAVRDWNKNSISYNSYDRETIPSSMFEMSVRYKFDMNDYFKHVGTEGWLFGRWEDVKNIVTKYKLAGSNFNVTESDLSGMNHSWLPIFKLELDMGIAYVDLIHVPGANFEQETCMEHYLTNPDKLLPYMYMQDGQVKTDWHPQVVETSQLLDENQNFRSLDELVELEAVPNILVGNKPMLSEDDNSTLERLTTLTKTYDKGHKLDAFVLPVNMVGTLTMEDSVKLENVYSGFPMLIKGNNMGYSETQQLISTIGSRLKSHFNGSRIQAMITTHLTNIVNRWLVECRGYPEPSRTGRGITIENIFDDLLQFMDYLKDKDPASLKAFTHLNDNDFFLSNFQLLNPRQEVEKYFNDKADKEDPISLVEARAQSNSNVVIQREAIIITMRKDVGPTSERMVKCKKSRDPKLFAIIEEAINRCEKHFVNSPTIFIRFETPKGGYLRQAVFSEFDQNVLNLRSIDHMQGLVLGLPPAV